MLDPYLVVSFHKRGRLLLESFVQVIVMVIMIMMIIKYRWCKQIQTLFFGFFCYLVEWYKIGCGI